MSSNIVNEVPFLPPTSPVPGAGTPDPSFPRSSFRADVVGRIFPQYPPPAPYLRLAFNRIGYHPFDPVLLLAIVVVLRLRLRLRPRRWRRRPVRRVVVGILIVPIVIVVVPIVPVVVVVVVVYFVVDVRPLPASLVDVEYLLEVPPGIVVVVVDAYLDQPVLGNDIPYPVR